MMNCRRIKDLIPLFVEGDLDAGIMNDVSLHLHDCAICSEMVQEYSASQAWLRTYEMPEFDNAFFMDLKQSVMQEIEQSQARPSWLQILTGRWNQNFAFAMAIALLILVSAFVISLYSGKAKIDVPQPGISKDNQPQDEPQQKENSPQPKNPEHKQEKNYRYVTAYRPKRSHPESVKKLVMPLPPAMPQTIEPLDNLAINIFDNTLETNPINMGDIVEAPTLPTSTRIEFQTSDPNIRIIWFAPKSNSSQSTKIDTE
jgi:hypothetical protein